MRETHAPLVVMGVSGAGKSTVAAALAERLGGEYLDADDLHSDEARAKMAAGIPLDDDDRWPWLDRVAARLAVGDARPVIACSALRRRYRDRLRTGADPVFVHLDGAPEVLARRMGARVGHFMPTGLLASQLATLEPLEADEPGFAVDIDDTPDGILATILLRLEAPAGQRLATR